MTENTTQDSTTTTAAEAGTVVEHLNPADLLVDVNIRHDARLDPDFLASVRDLGVLVPIVGVRTPTGEVRVRYGHRRTAAALAAGLTGVPVVVAADEATDDEATVARLVAQHAENTHRAGLTRTEEADVVAQLHLLGVSAHQIAKRTRIKRDQVDAALTVAGSESARTWLARHDLTLDQAAALAEFDDDDAVAASLLDAAQRSEGSFNHALSRARTDRAQERALSEFTGTLISAGHTLADADTGLPVDRLLDADGNRISVAEHATCPGHAVRAEIHHDYLDPATGRPPVEDDTAADDAEGDDQDGAPGDDADGEDSDGGDDEWDPEPADDLVWGAYPDATWVCLDPEAHGHVDRWKTYSGGSGVGSSYGEPRRKVADMDPAEAEAARAARRDVIESNKAWKAAEPVRRDWVRALLTRKTPPTGAAAFTAIAQAADRHIFTGQWVPALTSDLLGTPLPQYGQPHPVADLVAKASAKRCEVIALGTLLACYEANLGDDHWRNVQPTTARYLRFLDACGYERSNVERRAAGDDPIPEDADPAAYAGE